MKQAVPRRKTILSTPHTTRGKPEKDVVNSMPAKVGLMADARLRGTAVELAAAARSGGVTTAIT
jgi:hypothetical protein